MSNNNTNLLIKVLSALFSAFCGGKSSHDGGQHQQQGYGGQQQYQQQQQPYSNQQQAYPGQYPPQQQQQQPWSQVAGGGSPQHHQNNYNNQHRPPHQQNNYHQNNQHHQSQQQHHQNGGYQSKPHSGLPSGGILGPHAPQHQDQVNAANAKYQDLRNQARRAGDDAHRCFAASQQAYQQGDGGKAHDLSQEGKSHQQRQDQLDDEASAWIYNENNRDSPPGTIDLHGLYVKEAIERTEAAIAQAQQERRDELRVIVGKGIHSQGHVAKIKPAVQNLMQKYNLSAHIDPSNTGVLIVDLDGRENNGRTRDAGGLVDQMDRDQGGDCVIM